MKNYLDLVEYKTCTGCGACKNICPVGAIEMKEDNEGFLYPAINKEKCTNCGMCKKVCPILNNFSNKNTKTPKCFAVMANDEVRAKSSSGGMFTLVADYVLENNGYICGASYNKDWSVSHIIIDNKNDLDKLRGSKYLQSSTEDCYKEIKKLLKDNKLVLFTGCPCQVAGLKGYLQKNYDNLITMELLCHGAPSYKVFRHYLDENFDFSKIKRVSFRDKAVKWRSDYLTLEFDNNEIKHLKKIDCSYEAGFHKGLFNRPSCAPCHFAKLPRVADFTIADWWGISKFAPEMNDTKGTSLVLINNKNAQNIFKKIKKNMFKVKEISLNNAKKSCNVTIYRPLKHHAKRELFYSNLEKLSVKENVKLCFDSNTQTKYDVGLVGVNTGTNFGTQIQYYVLYRTIRDLGYSVLMINHPAKSLASTKRKNIPNRFMENPYDFDAFLDKQYLSKFEMRELNEIVDKFIVGSDQFFRYSLYKNFDEFMSLDWALDSKPKYGYAISFGQDKWEGDDITRAKIAYDLQKFDKITTRELSGIKLLKEQFGVEATHALEPVLIANKNIFYNLAQKGTKTLKNKYLFAYILDKNEEKTNVINTVCKNLNLDIEEINNNSIYKDSKENIYIEDWLKTYQNADFVITDSFHGVCLAIIFEKEFIFFTNKKRGITRFETLMKLFGIKDRMFTSIDNLSNQISSKINYNYINQQLEIEKEKSITYLKEILSEKLTKPATTYDAVMTMMYNNKDFNINEFKNLKTYIKYSKKSFYYKLKYTGYRLLLNICGKKSYEKIKAKKNKYKEIVEILNLYK